MEMALLSLPCPLRLMNKITDVGNTCLAWQLACTEHSEHSELL